MPISPSELLKSLRVLLISPLLAWLLLPGQSAAADDALILTAGGKPLAEVVIAADAPRLVVLAAEEFRDYIQRISGAELPVVHERNGQYPVAVFIGESSGTRALNITSDGLKDGAYRIESGEDWLVLLGKDSDFEPREPFTLVSGRTNPDRLRVMQEWDELSNGTFGNPIGLMRTMFNRDLGIYTADEGGSLNAVYGMLRKLGVRWYMPGELGEVFPTLDQIVVPSAMQVEVHPAFAWRQFYFAHYHTSGPEDILWYLRQGFTHDQSVGHVSHGLRDVLSREEMQASHPEFYALRGDQREFERGHACLSNPGLVEAAAGFARAMFDVYDVPSVSVMPQDGMRFCQCELCAGKESVDRGRRGLHSNYVWEFVDAVAREVYTTHPDRTINCFSYGTYTLPPTTIERLSPNVVVGIVHARGKDFHIDPPNAASAIDAEDDSPALWSRSQLLELRRQWRKLTDNPFIGWEHYVFTHRGTYAPVFFPAAITAGIRSMEGEFMGELVEVATGPFEERGHGLHAPAFNHLNIWLTGRLYWDPDQDVRAVLDEYFLLFYGPAALPMQAFVEYCETTWRTMLNDPQQIQVALTLFDEAVALTKAGTVYAKRLGLLNEYLDALRIRLVQINNPRDGVPSMRLAVADDPITLDGRLDEPVWQQVPSASLSLLETATAPEFSTEFRIFWQGNRTNGFLCIGIRCSGAPPADHPQLSNGMRAILDNENVQIMIETQTHSYYQIVISPCGAVVDFDRQGDADNDRWSSMADVAVHHDDYFWSAEIRIPVPGEDVLDDPLHQIAGRYPRLQFPWHINIGRQRMTADGVEISAWSANDNTCLSNTRRFGRLSHRR